MLEKPPGLQFIRVRWNTEGSVQMGSPILFAQVPRGAVLPIWLLLSITRLGHLLEVSLGEGIICPLTPSKVPEMGFLESVPVILLVLVERASTGHISFWARPSSHSVLSSPRKASPPSPVLPTSQRPPALTWLLPGTGTLSVTVVGWRMPPCWCSPGATNMLYTHSQHPGLAVHA